MNQNNYYGYDVTSDPTDYSAPMPKAGTFNGLCGYGSSGSGSLLVVAVAGAIISVLTMWLL